MNQTQFVNTIQDFEDKMYRVSKYILVSEDAAKDALQEVFMKLWQQKDKLSSVKYIEAYLIRITKNYCFDQLKLKANQNLRLVTEEFEVESQKTEEKVESEDEDIHKVQLVKQAMKDLPKLQQLVMQLRDLENYTFQEIAEILDITEGAARVNLSRARKTIVKQLKNKLS
jgi:RNA polymerase sigma-70 factor (ECF subfamily)